MATEERTVRQPDQRRFRHGRRAGALAFSAASLLGITNVACADPKPTPTTPPIGTYTTARGAINAYLATALQQDPRERRPNVLSNQVRQGWHENDRSNFHIVDCVIADNNTLPSADFAVANIPADVRDFLIRTTLFQGQERYRVHAPPRIEASIELLHIVGNSATREQLSCPGGAGSFASVSSP